MAARFATAGPEALELTKRHSRQFLRGITDFDSDGNYAWKDPRYAPHTYQFSRAAWVHRDADTYRDLLHGEHVIPVTIVFQRLIRLVEEGASEEELMDFLEESLIVVWVTVQERKMMDGELGLSRSMPTGWDWGDDPYSRLVAARIELEQESPRPIR